jgi:hypothetical protein
MVGIHGVKEHAAAIGITSGGKKRPVENGLGPFRLADEHPDRKIQCFTFKHIWLKIHTAGSASLRTAEGACFTPLLLSPVYSPINFIKPVNHWLQAGFSYGVYSYHRGKTPW